MVDADSGAVLGTISGLKRCHGVALVPQLGRRFISDGDAAQTIIFDLQTLKQTGQLKGEADRIPSSTIRHQSAYLSSTVSPRARRLSTG